ncbi:hypothetical protein CHLRE_12g533000v5 [Chlamydomonas reinhardtii]|uniref:Deoxyribodipyrimidine photo-lyase n=1 Tax=Chlamydomonas reinhardtii TaxID=3055 RepID=Q9XHE2_CHLRE|nr:uncharacterized protein CHLRE_12g533000v5 [Chlamydomonas reinhardtii]AAD39433.1 class II DNA photolyase [Chlamydomonas reinhardtii]PNW75594.1 hypothetical protein CHLRE_12g533000v5 [Chlamydomonas reinhardtii]
MSSKRKATEAPAAGEDGAAGPSSKKQAAASASAAAAAAGAGSAAAGGALVNPKRVRVLKPGSIGKGPVVYWMSRDQRLADNWALLHAIEAAQGAAGSSQVAVAFNLVPAFLGAGARQFGFMLRGLRQLAPRLEARGIKFYLLKGDPAHTLPQLVSGLGAGLLVTDYSPLRLGRTWRDQVCSALGSVPVHEVDAHNVVPVWAASEKREVGARTLRPKIHKALPEFLREFPEVPTLPAWTPAVAPEAVDWDGLISEVLSRGADVPEVEWCTPGEEAALEALTGPRGFLSPARLSLYDTKRNDPATPSALSGLSPYLHFGQLAPQRAALEAAKHRAKYKAAVESYLEELVVRRELADNFCHYCPTYDSLEAAAEWARDSLDKHRTDKREFLYTRDQLECGATHDELWNAAQLEMVHVGKMHGFMRMYWAKKILEWTQGPEQAIEWAIYLNDRYELDGRDPGGYTGVLWSMAGVHDMGWAERAVFGKIRYMNYNGCKRKFDIKAYVAYVSKAVAEAKAKGRAAKLPSAAAAGASGAAAAGATAAAAAAAAPGPSGAQAAKAAKAKAEPKEAKPKAAKAAAKAKGPKDEKAAAAGAKRKAAKPAKSASSGEEGSDDE